MDRIDTTTVQKLLKKKYNLEGELISLVGYDDINFRFNCPDGEKYVIKFSKARDSALLKFQSDVLDEINKSISTSVFPRLIPDVNDNNLINIRIGGEDYILRVLSWLEGELLISSPRSEKLYFNLGKTLGELDKVLYDSGLWYNRKENFEWDLQYALISANYLQLIPDPEDRRIITYFLQQFEYFVSPHLKVLRKGVIQSDANYHNVLVDGDEVTGIIDFGDAVYSPVINELAIAIAYCLMDTDDFLSSTNAIVKGYHEKFTLEEIELDVLYYLIAARLCVTVCQAVNSRKTNPDNEYLQVSEKPALRLLHRWIEFNPYHFTQSIKNILGFRQENSSLSQFVDVRTKYVNPSLSVSYNIPIKMVKAAFQYMYSEDGTTYLDCVNNICHVGHSHPAVVAAATKQIATLNTNTRYYYDLLNNYTEKLAAKFPDPLNVVYLVNSGSEAGDLAQRIARTVTCYKTTVVVDHAYHGNTLAGIEISPYKHNSKGGDGRVDHIHCLDIPDGYRGRYKYEDPEAGVKYAMQIDEVIKQVPPLAAFYCESIIGCGGQVTLPKGYLPYIYEKTRAAGGLCIADEVQVGFGRVGEAFWAFQLQDVVPDIVVIGKPMGNGHPLAAVVTTKKIADTFNNGMEYFSSFGGNPVSCAIGEAVLDVIETEGLQQNALETGNYFKAELERLSGIFPLIGDVRGYGLFLGVELVEDRKNMEPATLKAREIIEMMKESGILLSTDGPFNNVLKIKPPMTFTKTNVDTVINKLDDTFNRIQ